MTPANEPAPLATTPPPGRIVRATQTVAHGFRQMVGAQAISAPRIDPKLTQLPVIERSAEVLHYTLSRTEHWLSPGGTLRAVMRLSLKLALLIGMPVLIVGPAVLLLLEGAAAASGSLVTIAVNLAAMSFSLIIAVLGVAVLTALMRTLLRKK